MNRNMYAHKPINVGFVILCPNCNTGQLRTTISSIKHNYPNSPLQCVFPEHCHPEDIKEAGKTCTTIKAGTTITSLINAGMSPPPCPQWNFVVVGGSWIKGLLDRKYSYFMEDEKDIMFPIADRKMNFVDGTLNGILLHAKAFQEIGPFPNDSPIEVCKLMWALGAVDLGYRFKAVLGTTIS